MNTPPRSRFSCRIFSARATCTPADAKLQPGIFAGSYISRNREYKALIGTIAGLAVVWLRMWLQRRYGY